MGEKAAVVGQLRRNLSVAAIHSQCLSLHGRLETLASGRRECAKQGDRDVQHSWAMDRERQANSEALRHQSFLRKGFGKVD